MPSFVVLKRISKVIEVGVLRTTLVRMGALAKGIINYTEYKKLHAFVVLHLLSLPVMNLIV